MTPESQFAVLDSLQRGTVFAPRRELRRREQRLVPRAGSPPSGSPRSAKLRTSRSFLHSGPSPGSRKYQKTASAIRQMRRPPATLRWRELMLILRAHGNRWMLGGGARGRSEPPQPALEGPKQPLFPPPWVLRRTRLTTCTFERMGERVRLALDVQGLVWRCPGVSPTPRPRGFAEMMRARSICFNPA
jgi:hypothetical protein